MKIKNETQYQTKHLRAFVTRIAKKELADVPASRRKAITIEFVPNRTRRSSSGYAYINGYYARVRVPKDITPENHWKVAMVIAHEMAHLAGRKSGRANERAMRSSIPYGWHQKTPEYYSWAADLPLENKVVKVKPKPTALDKAEAHLARLEKNISNWETKAKRAKSALAKYRKQVKYYQGRVVALVDAPPVEPKPRAPRKKSLQVRLGLYVTHELKSECYRPAYGSRSFRVAADHSGKPCLFPDTGEAECCKVGDHWGADQDLAGARKHFGEWCFGGTLELQSETRTGDHECFDHEVVFPCDEAALDAFLQERGYRLWIGGEDK